LVDSTGQPAAAAPVPDHLRPRYRRWLLGLLTLATALNFLDRKIINILAEPIKRDLHLSDAQLGALTGLAFALLYCTAALPIARIADRSDRVRVFGVSILVWSVFTAIGGAAGSFIHLFLLRIGVGIGEAGCAPPAQSLIVDHFPPEKRSSALSILMSGQSIGGAAGLILGGLLGGWLGWRWSLVLAGVPGLVVGALVLGTLTDPRRREAPGARAVPPTVGRVLGTLLRKPAFLLVSLGFASVGVVSYTTTVFAGSFYLRVHNEDLTRLAAGLHLAPIAVIGLGLGLFGSLGGAAGSIVGGVLGDRLAARDVRALAYLPAVGMLLATAGYIGMFTVPDAGVSLLLSAVATFCMNLFSGPGSLALQHIAGKHARATALAVTTFIASGIGLGIAPVATGMLSDILGRTMGTGEGLRVAILVSLVAGPLGAAAFAAAGRTLARDFAEEN
jgi:MFS family permease